MNEDISEIINSLSLGRCGSNYKDSFFFKSVIRKVSWALLWNCSQVKATFYHYWGFNLGTGNGLMPSGNRLLLKAMLIMRYTPNGVFRPHWVNSGGNFQRRMWFCNLPLQWRHIGRDGVSNLTIFYSTVYSGADQRKHQISASLAFARGVHRWPHKGQVTRKMFPFHDAIMHCASWWHINIWCYAFSRHGND